MPYFFITNCYPCHPSDLACTRSVMMSRCALGLILGVQARDSEIGCIGLLAFIFFMWWSAEAPNKTGPNQRPLGPLPSSAQSLQAYRKLAEGFASGGSYCLDLWFHFFCQLSCTVIVKRITHTVSLFIFYLKSICD